ncbi:hypothetical protein [Nocardia arizonensis]|uniref:hypothetical protein n=1 Tax=Nocardia arizonensis TaxID=1141647 RepID=UPI0006D1EC0A|nr:hypothetical protein [Nocardia arizonensis]
MNYDHVLVPSLAASTVDEVEDYLAGQQGVPQTGVVAEMADVLNARNAELPAEDTFLGTESVGGAATGAALYVSSPYDAIGFVRALLFEIATPRDYAVYDPQLAWLIDPAGRVDVAVSHGGAGEFPYLTEAMINQWIPALAAPNPYVIVEQAEQVYIQTYREPSGVYTLEYRDGGPDRHFGATVEDPRQVARVIWAWTVGDPVPDLGWKKIDF